MASTGRTPEQWQQLIDKQVSSGMQVATFCREHNLNTSSFYAWRHRLANKEVSSSISPSLTESSTSQAPWVNISSSVTLPTSPCPDWDIELALPHGIILRMMKN